MKNPMLENLLRGSKISNMPQNILMQNPQFRQVMQYVKDNGGDAKAAFYKKAQEMGIDPNEVLAQLR